MDDVEQRLEGLTYQKHREFNTVAQNDENFIGYRTKLEEVNYRVINKLMKVSIFCTCFMLIEFIGGWIAGSLAIMTDAAHLLSDLSGFLISMFSLYIALRPANFKLTYGYHRAEVIGALSSILIIWILTVWLIAQAIYRLYNPQPIQGLVMMSVAALGLIFNLIMSQILMSENIPNAFEKGDDSHDDIRMEGEEYHILRENENEIKDNEDNLIQEARDKDNPILRAAFIHILGDIIQSAGVFLAAIIIYFFQDTHPNINIVDPICTFVFAIIVLSTSIPVSKDCINVLMEATPSEVKIDVLTKELSQVIGVENIHDIHVWCISVGKPSISLHILSNSPQKSLEQATIICKKHGIHHTTIQVEDNTQKRRPSFINCTHAYDNTIH
jgi:cation diffusion facilitator family transporter